MAFNNSFASAISVALAFSLGGAALAQSKPYVVEGPGRMVCEDVSRTASSDPKVQAVSIWLTGYLTAHNRLIEKVFDLTPWQTQPVLMSLLLQYCKANPQHVVEKGAQELVAYLIPNALQKEAEVVAVGSGSDVVLLYLPVVANIRDKLKLEGYLPGTSMESLLQSIKAFQTKNGLSATGLPDQKTLTLLLK